MIARHWLASLALLLIAAAPDSDNRSFGKWEVGCDNLQTCRAIGDPTSDSDGWPDMALVVDRAGGGPGALTVRVIAMTKQGITGTIRLAVDGQDFGAQPRDADGTATWTGGPALRLARALAMGSTATITPNGKPPQIQSLAGASAALRFVDAMQNRAGSIAALVATGTAADQSVAPALPYIKAWQGARTAPAPPALARQLRLRFGVRLPHNCGDRDNGPPHDNVLPLDATHTLVLLSCGLGAYNLPAIGYVITAGQAGSAMLAPGIAQTKTNGIVNADFDARTGVLSSFGKGRGIADCGVAQSWAWTGTGFALLSISQLDQCSGISSDWWITRYRAALAPSPVR